jgi:hypothetical protein
MPYLNEYNEKLANDINALNREYVLNESVTLDPRSQAGFTGGAKLSGGFLGAIASALLPSLLPMVLGKLTGQGKLKVDYDSDSDSECENKKGGSMYNSMRDNLEGSGMASKDYKYQSEEKYNCGMGKSGGSSYGLGEGSLRDTGEGVTDSQLLQLGEGKKKRGRKSKMGAGKSGGGIISNMGIPVISGLAGLFGLGRSGGVMPPMEPVAVPRKRMLSKTQDVPLSYGSTVPQSGGALGRKRKVNTFEPKILAQTAPTSTKAVSPVGVVDKALNIGSNLSGFGKKRGRKSKMEGNGIISGLNIPVVSGLAGLFGLGKKGKKKSQHQMPDGSMMDDDKMCGSAKKSNPWMQLMAKVRKEHPELKGVKAVIAYIKQHNLYKK